MKIIPIQKIIEKPKADLNRFVKNDRINLTKHYENTLKQINDLITDHFNDQSETKKRRQ